MLSDIVQYLFLLAFDELLFVIQLFRQAETAQNEKNGIFLSIIELFIFAMYELTLNASYFLNTFSGFRCVYLKSCCTSL